MRISSGERSDPPKGRFQPRGVSCSKNFSFLEYGDLAKAAAEAHQSQIVSEHSLQIKNQYRYRHRPQRRPHIECHIKDAGGDDHYLICDVEDLPLLKAHTWHVARIGDNIYAMTSVSIDGKKTTKEFQSLKRPDWPMVDHINRNGLDNRSKNLRDGSGGVNQDNCRLQKNNTSGANGVCYEHARGRWSVRDQAATRARFRTEYFRGPENKAHPSHLAARAYRREQAAAVGNLNGQEPEDSGEDV